MADSGALRYLPIKRRAFNLLLMLSGLLCGVAVVFSDVFGGFIWIFPSVMLALLINYSRQDRSKIRLGRIYLAGVLYFECYYIVCYHWFCYLYPMTFTGLDGFSSVVVIAVAWFGLSLLQALGGGLFFLAFAALAKLGVFENIRGAAIISLPLIYSLFEFSQTIGWWGVPFGRLPIALAGTPAFFSTSSLLGPYFTTAVIIFVNAAIAYAALALFSDRRRAAAFLLLGAFVFSLNLCGGVILDNRARAIYDNSDKLTVAAIQGNFSSTDSWDATEREIIKVYESLTREAVSRGAELVLWPETSLPFDIFKGERLHKDISALADELDIYLAVGALRYIDEDIFNCTYLVSPDGEFDQTRYDKRHLVPFGEYVPMKSVITTLIPALGQISMLSEDMTAGNSTAIFDIGEIGKVGATICFDSIYEQLFIDTVSDGAELILLGTNDSWFQDSPAVHMHNKQAVMRAVEMGRSVLRAAVTGVSSVITPYGEITDATDTLVEDFALGEVALISERTVYSVIGNAFIWAAAAEIAVFIGLSFILGKRRKRG